MKKILSIFAAALVASSMMADPVVLPATLDVTNVSFRSEGMPDFVIEEGQDYAGTYFDMGAHDSSNDTLLYAEWDVTIEPILYNLSVDVYNTNSWRVQLYLLNQAGDTLKSLRYKGSSAQKGNFAIGSLDLSDLEAGDYKVRAHAATAWSQMKLKDVIFEADYQGVNVALPGTLLPAYAVLSDGASVTNNAIAFTPSTANNEYAIWNVSFEAAGSFNVAIDITALNGHNYGVALLSADGQTEIASVNEGGQHGDTGVKELGAIEVPAAGTYTVKLTNATQWSEAVLNSISFAAPAASEYYLVGTMNNWQVDENYKMTLNEAADDVEYMIDMTLAVGDEFKVFEDNGTADGVWHPGAANYVVDADHVGEATVYFRPNGKQGDESWYYTIIYVAMKEEPQPAEAQLWKVTAETPTAAGSTLIDDDLMQLASVYLSFVSGTNHTYGEEQFAKAFQIRAKNAPTEDNLTGEENETTDDTKKASPLVLTAKEDIEVTFYYRQQQTAETPAAENDNKDLWIYDQAAITAKLTGTHTSVDVSTDSKYAFVTKKMTFTKNHVYTLTAVGTTLPLFGIQYQIAGQVPTAISNTEMVEKAVKVFQNGQLMIIKNGVKYNVLGMTL